MGTPATFPGAKLYMSPSTNGSYATAPTEAYEFSSETLQKRGTILDTAGSAGTRQHKSERTRAGTYAVGGNITLFPTPTELRALLPRIQGTAESGSGTSGSPYVYAVAETLPSFYVTKDIATKVFHYTGCKVARATFSASAGSMLQLSLDIEGLTEVVAAAASVSSPATLDILTQPFMFHEGVYTIQSYARPVSSFELTIDNGLDTSRFLNSQTRTNLTELDRTVGINITTPYTPGTGTSGETDLYDQSNAGAAVNLVFTSTVNANKVLTIILGTAQFPSQTPMRNGRGEYMLELSGVARKVSSTSDCSFALQVS